MISIGIALSFAFFSGKRSIIVITLLENGSTNPRGAGLAPIEKELFRCINPEIRTFHFKAMGMFKKPATDGLSETFNLEEGILVFRAALSTDNGRMAGDFRLIEELLHEELIFNIIVRKLVNAEKRKMAVIFDTCLKFLRIFHF